MARMLSCANPSQVAGLARFFKTGPGQYGYGDKFLGIKVPVTRSVVRECWKDVTFDDLEECVCSEYHEIRLAGLLALVEVFRHAKRSSSGTKPSASDTKQSPSGTKQSPSGTIPSASGTQVVTFGLVPEVSLKQHCIDFYLSHLDSINNWDLVDLSCYPLLGEWLLDSPDRSLLYSLARDGRTIWEQRIGIVSTMTFVRHGQLADTFAIADILLHHPHDLIHKAVGWLLREAGKRDKPALEAYLSPRYAVMPRTMLRYAIEKFPEPERQYYLAK